MTTAEFINLIKQGEGETIEFKQTVKDIARNICAFWRSIEARLR